MDIKSIRNQQIDRTKLDKVKSDNTASAKSSSSQTASSTSDKVSISNDSQVSTFDVAKSELRKLDESSFQRIKEIRQNVNDGVYATDESIQNVAKSIEKDIQQLEADFIATQTEPDYPVDVEKLKSQLAENGDIIKDVAERLSKILSNL